MGNTILDVREIQKNYRKKTILTLFNDLSDNECLVLISDHNLAPLYKLFRKEKSGFFKWEDTKDGPEIWEIKIQKTKSLNLTINEILNQFPSATEIFEQYGIPYFKLGIEKLCDITELFMKKSSKSKKTS